MKFALLPLTVLLIASSASGQEAGNQNPNLKVPEVARVTEIERLFHAYGATHGGRQELKRIKTLSFRMIPVFLSDEGELEKEPSMIDVQLEGVDRMMRLQEELDGQTIVKSANGMEEASIWINGEKRDVPERIASARQESAIFYLLLDLLYKPESEDLKARFSGEKERDGRLHYAVEYEFHPSRKLEHTYRVFYDKNDGLVRRIDVHDTGTRGNIRINTMILSEYAPTAEALERVKLEQAGAVERATKRLEEAETPEEIAEAETLLARAKIPSRSPMFPGRIEIQNRDGTTAVFWRMVDVEINGEFEPGHFTGP